MRNLLLGLIYLSFTFKISDAAIVPADKTYEVKQNDDLTIDWVYDNQDSMLIVTWTFKNSTEPTAKTVMTQLSGSDAMLVPGIGYDIQHEQNGTITLKSVGPEDIGTYKCIVTYTGFSPETGTATIKLKATAEEEKSQCEAGCIAGVTAGCCACLAGAGVGGYIYKKKKNGNKPGRYDPTNNSHGDKP